jgi:hypothetical protein
MSNFLRSLFGSKKSNPKIKPRMQSRRLELIGLEERVTPAVVASFSGNALTLLSDSNDTFSVSSDANGVISITGTTVTAGDANVTVVAGSTSTVTVNSLAGGAAAVQVLALTGDNATEIQDITLININSTAFNTNFGISFALDAGNDTVKLGGSINLNGTGTLLITDPASGVDAVVLGQGSDLTLTSVSGAITLTPAGTGATNVTTMSNNATINSTSGNITLGNNVVGAGKNLSINSGTGTVTATGTLGLTTALGKLTITSTNATSSAISLAAVTAGDVILTGTGDVSVSGVVAVTSINAKSTAGDVIFGNTVTTSAVGGFVSEATLATKATKIANAVTVGAGANALVTGNLISNNATLAAITTSGVGNITITGNVDASVAGNGLTLTAGSGLVSIIGNVGSSAPSFGTLTASGTGTFLAAGTVTAGSIKLDQSNKFATSITFAKAVTVSDSPGGLEVNADGSGTVTFSDTITALGATSNNTDIEITSVNGVINVGGAITGLDKVAIISSGSGSITLIGNVTTSGTSTTQDNGNIIIQSATGNIVTSGSISTSGANANIEIDTATSGNVTIGGNVSTSGGGDILLGADFGGVATGAGNVTINGTVTTTGAGAGDILIGISGGTATVNQALTAGPTGDVVFLTNLATDAITVASGATITAGDSVGDFGSGILNLGANITSGTTGVAATLGIFINDVSVNLTGDVSLKSIGTGGGAGIFLGKVNGAQNLTLESTDQILLGSVGQAIALNTVTVTNSGGVTAGAFTAANVVLTDTTGTIAFGGTTVITNSLTTAAKAYDVTFAGTTTIFGAPVFLNTGNVSFAGNTTLISGATITGAATTNVSLSGNITTAIGDINIGALPVTTIANGTNIIFNGSGIDQVGTFAGVVNMVIGDELYLTNGELVLSGDSSAAFLGDIYLYDATVNVTGKIGSASNIFGNLGLITGPGGTIGNVVAQTITIVDPQGTLNTGVVTFNAATTYIADVLTTTTASNLTGNSGFNLGGANLFVETVASGLAVGNSFTIINNTAVSGGLTGQFFAQPEGSSISAFDASGNIVTFTVSYIGGTNANDVTLTVASVTPQTPTPAATPQPMVAGQPALNKFTAVGADAGAGPLVTITFQNGTFVSFFAYAPAFTGGVRVALGDVNGDGSTDVITGAGSNGGPQVNVFNVDNITGAVSLQTSFFAFDEPFFAGGVYVAAADTNDDGFDDVVVGAGAGGGPRVQVYAGSATGLVTSSTLNDFFAYSLDFAGGVVVAAGDRNADGDSEVITAPASNGGFNIKSFDVNGNGNSPTLVDNFFAFNDTTSVGGLSLAVGFFDFTNIADLVVGTTNSAFGVFLDSDTSGIATVPFAGFTGAIRAGVAEDSFGQEYAVALAGPTGGPRISVFSVGVTSLDETDNLFVMNPAFTGGLFGTPTLGD